MSDFVLGVLEVGRPSPKLAAKHGSYPDLFRALLSPHASDMNICCYAVLDGVFPQSVNHCDAWLVTGSPTSVLDDDPWIEPLRAFLAQAHSQQIPIVGICFGHQILAEALGGRVEVSGKGWGAGVHRYDVYKQASWMDPKPREHRDSAEFAIQALHQDQVVELPEDAEVLAGSDFCPYGVLSYGDTAISFQGHPEINAVLARDIINLRRGDQIPQSRADHALDTVDDAEDANTVARWIVRFLRQAPKDNDP